MKNLGAYFRSPYFSIKTHSIIFDIDSILSKNELLAVNDVYEYVIIISHGDTADLLKSRHMTHDDDDDVDVDENNS
jgi:hypothetical protein